MLSTVEQGAGLPPLPASLDDIRLASIGLEGTRVTPRRLLRAFTTVVMTAHRRRSPADQILLDGLRAAAQEGTASALAEGGIDAWAKTGTAQIKPGQFGGLVVALVPAEDPRVGVVVVGAGIAGRDAAAIAVAALRRVAGSMGGGVAGRESPAPAGVFPEDGRVRLGVAGPDGYRVRALPLEDYVAGVVAGEAGIRLPVAAREALAIVARSYALASRGRHEGEGFDLCDLTHCQAWREPDAASTAAAATTAGTVLWWNRQVVPAFHSASCGGQLEAPSALWPGQRWDEVMAARADPAGSGHGDDWVSEVTAPELLSALRASGWRGDEIRALRIEARTPSGRARVLALDGLTPAHADGEAFRLAVGRRLGWHVLKSSLYDVRRTARGYRFEGRGRGHGVGFCVAGAATMARAGVTASGIVAAYFLGARLGPASPQTASTALRIELPALDESERRVVEAIVARAAAAVERRSGIPLPAGTRLRFHDSVRAYQRASGQPWWTAGATRGTEVDLLPLQVLRERRLLESTVRHELAHVVTMTRLPVDVPRWVREGAARHIAGEVSENTAAVSGPCPEDREFEQARSAAQLQVLYDQALGCFTGRLARVQGEWWRVR